jgi:hypothetical protein
MFSLFRLFVILTLPVVWHVGPASAWGAKGHKIVAMIAANRLDSAAQRQVRSILADDPAGGTLPAIAFWADVVKKTSRPQTENWHFVNIPVGEQPAAFDRARDCRPNPRRGDCIVAAVERLIERLADVRTPARERREALKFVTHLVADLHQPLHCAERGDDRGGNGVDVTLLGERGWTLHSVWDSGLLTEGGLSPNKYVQKLTQWLHTQNTARIAAGTPMDWANQAHALAVSHAYRTPTGRSIGNRAKLDRRYVDAALVVVDQQLARAGVRLAAVLNATLR